jgi:hypothetical protein
MSNNYLVHSRVEILQFLAATASDLLQTEDLAYDNEPAE